MMPRDHMGHPAREAVEVMATGRALPYAALLVSSVVLGFELFRG